MTLVQIASTDLFDGLHREDEQEPIRKLERKEGVLEQLVRNYRIILRAPALYAEGVYQITGAILEEIGPLEISAGDIQQFLIKAQQFEKSKRFSEQLGPYLSVCINKSRDENFVLNLQHLSHRLDHLCMNNIKNVIIYGDAGDYLGRGMAEGKIVLHGNSNNRTGNFMTGGILHVLGNVFGIGAAMGTIDGGEIIVEGDAGLINPVLRNGTITIKGDVESDIFCLDVI